MGRGCFKSVGEVYKINWKGLRRCEWAGVTGCFRESFRLRGKENVDVREIGMKGNVCVYGEESERECVHVGQGEQ